MIFVMADAGLRADEVCRLRIGDVDRGSGELTIVGKGNKQRNAYLGTAARRALWRYLETERRQALSDEPLFVSGGGTRSGSALTPSGVYQILRGAGEAAGVTRLKCGPHTLRRTFSINFLRGGGNLMELASLLGHSDLTVLRPYVALSDTDLAQAHRKASPADRMKLR